MRKLQLIDDRGRLVAATCAAILFIFSLLTFLTGLTANNEVNRIKPTKIGATGAFKNTSAQATVKQYITDKNNDVLGIRIGLSELSNSPLPYKAQDYFVSWTGDGDISGYFGRYSTDGDLFVFIPYPKKDVTYTITITNLNFLGGTSNEIKDKSLSSIKGSVSKQLSVTSMLGDGDSTSKEESNSRSDSITFKMTINDKTNTDKYKITTIDTKSGSLLKTDKDGKISFDFKSYWEAVYKKPQVDKASENLQNSIERESKAQEQFNSFKERYDRNNDDTTAQTQMKNYANEIDKEQVLQEDYSKKLEEAQNLKFDPDDFSDYTTKIYSVKK